jgi:hypothetical protein
MDNIIIPFSLQNSNASRVARLEWLSRMSRTGWLRPHFMNLEKKFQLVHKHAVICPPIGSALIFCIAGPTFCQMNGITLPREDEEWWYEITIHS